jgi:Leucine-rich repeat (LRR) protein
VNNLAMLEELNCCGNYLTDLNFLNNLNPEKLTNLSLRNNNFPEQDLSVFSKFINLEGLHVGNDEQEKINQSIYNRFIGSLAPLKDLTKLKRLDVSNTDINEGIEYLPSSIKKVCSSSKERPESKVKEISEQLNYFPKWVKKGFDGQQFKE